MSHPRSDSHVAPGQGFKSASVKADGFTLSYSEAGSGDPILRVPGAGGPAFSYALDSLAETNRMIELELPGLGDSPINHRTTGAAAMADTVAATIEALGVAPVHLWGTSMGGVVATHLAVRHGDLLRSLILEAPGPFRIGGHDPTQLAPDKLQRAFNAHSERVSWRAPTLPDPERWKLVVTLMGPDHDADLEARLPEIPVPTLVMFGVDDGIFPPAAGEIYRDSVPDCAYVLIEGAAHDIQGDQPEVCAKLVREFLADGRAFTASHHDDRVPGR